MHALLLPLILSAVTWQHPAGMIDASVIAEVREKVASQPWAAALYDSRKRGVQRWADLPSEELRRVFPKVGGNVYHNFSCPRDRVRLTFDPFNPDTFTCPTCGTEYAPDTDAGIYPPGDPYHGDLYAGWICLFHLTASQSAVDLALLGRMEDNGPMLDRAVELLMLYASTLPAMPLRPSSIVAPNHPTYRQYGRILTYHREGDNKILCDLTQAYELVRDRMTAEQRAAFEKNVIQRLLDDIMMEPYYVYDHNNIYQWHRTIVQAGLALEREDLIDWSFGFGPYSRENLPEHRSMSRILATHFNPDGAFWELCSGYHLYPLYALCDFAVQSRHLSAMDPVRFPPEQYDLTQPESAGGRVIHDALAWFVSMAMPDRSMTIVGDSTRARSGMDDYTPTAEIGYRYFGIEAVGDYPALREGKRSWDGLLYGSPEIVQHDTPFTSSYLSSGWVSLRNDWEGNRVWAGLNALIKGGGHQHADRLTLTIYSQGELLALEKSVPYNEATLRELGTETAAHNTVTVDFASQPQGERLTEEQTPRVVYFHAGPEVQFTEVHGDHLYPQAPVYRRSVALVEDLVLDCFRVEGGETHDWIMNHTGTAPALSLETAEGDFEPRAWLANGSSLVRTAASGDAWTAQWPVNGITSRLTMLGAPETRVFAVETYPLNNAVVTPAFPPTQTLCVRRSSQAPFVAVWDAWKDQPNLVSVASAEDRPDALFVASRENTYYVAFGPGSATFADGTRLESNAAFTVVRGRQSATLVHGTTLTIEGSGARGTVLLTEPATVYVAVNPTAPEVQVFADIAHDTRGGEDYARPAPAITPVVDGDWLRVQ